MPTTVELHKLLHPIQVVLLGRRPDVAIVNLIPGLIKAFKLQCGHLDIMEFAFLEREGVTFGSAKCYAME
jgi:hypothetical protein